MPRDRNQEPVEVLEIRPDGSRRLGRWVYEYSPTEGWVWNEWVEPPPDHKGDQDEIYE